MHYAEDAGWTIMMKVSVTVNGATIVNGEGTRQSSVDVAPGALDEVIQLNIVGTEWLKNEQMKRNDC